MEDFKPSGSGIIYVKEPNGSKSPVLSLPSTPNTLISVRRQSYKHEASDIVNHSVNLVIYKDAGVDGNGRIVWTNGSSQAKSTLMCKHIRHCGEISKFMSMHKKNDDKHITIYDNDINRAVSGSQTWQFNKGLPSDQHESLQKEGIEYLLVQNVKKPRPNSPNNPTHFMIGGKDMEVFSNFVHEIRVYYEGLENTSTNLEHTNRIVESYIAESIERKRRAPHEEAKKRSTKIKSCGPTNHRACNR